MDQKTIIAIVGFFIVLVGGMFMFAHLKRGEIQETQQTATTTPTPEVKYASITKIDAKHYYIDGVHTLVGEIPMPTPCDLLEASASAVSLEEVLINFTVINNATSCTQVVTPQRFKVSATANEDAAFRALFVGREVELNLIPAGPGENPDEFEVFLKG
jgi:hypothetical protein